MASVTGSTVTPIVAAANINTTVKNESQTLGKDAFLKLLLAEMKYQDPLSPMDNKDSVAQLAQFSALEKTENLNKSFDSFANSQRSNNMISSFAMVGKLVDAKVTKEETITETVDGVAQQKKVSYSDTVTGSIASVDNVNGEIRANLISTDGKSYTTTLNDIVKIQNPDSQKVSTIMSGAVLIGKTVEGTVTKTVPKSEMVNGVQVVTSQSVEEAVSGKVMSISLKDGQLVAKIRTTDDQEYTLDVNKVTAVQS